MYSPNALGPQPVYMQNYSNNSIGAQTSAFPISQAYQQQSASLNVTTSNLEQKLYKIPLKLPECFWQSRAATRCETYL